MKISKLSSIALLALAFSGCLQSTANGGLSLTGKTYSQQEEIDLGINKANEDLKSQTVSKNKKQKATLMRVAKKIIKAANQPDYQWDTYLIEDPQPNARVYPGGKIFVNTGLMNFVDTDDELAAVLGHEVAHATLHHTIKNLTANDNSTFVTGLAVAGAAHAIGDDDEESKLLKTGVAVGASLAKEYLIDKPFGRGQETDADKEGVELMIKAGYDPKYAITFWEKMAKNSDGTPQFFSTHPSEENRAKTLEEYIAKRAGEKKWKKY